MSIHVKQRAAVSQEFIETIKAIAQMKLDYFKQRVEIQGVSYTKLHASDINYSLSIIREQNVPGKGLDLEVTNLRSLPYISYGSSHLEGFGDYIYAQSSDLICTSIENELSEQNLKVYRRRGWKIPQSRQWDTGPWMVVIPTVAFITGSLEKIHMIPQRAAKALYRHPHHYAHTPGSDWYANDETMHPLLKQTRTCWSGFGAPMPMALNRGSISETLRLLYQFLTSCDWHSPLARERDLPHFILKGEVDES
jgi:hypothetical protein